MGKIVSMETMETKRNEAEATKGREFWIRFCSGLLKDEYLDMIARLNRNVKQINAEEHGNYWLRVTPATEEHVDCWSIVKHKYMSLANKTSKNKWPGVIYSAEKPNATAFKEENVSLG